MANQIKLARLEQQIMNIINKALMTEVENKYAQYATVTKVELSKDTSVAKIYLDCLKREHINKVIENVEKVSGFLRTKIAKALNLYKAPQLKFVDDKTIDYANNIEKLLNEIKEKENK